MKPKYLEADSRGARDRWMVSYADVLTILLIFFICAAMKAQRPPAAAAAHPAAPAVAVPQPPPAPPAPEPPISDLQKRLQDTGLEVHREPRGVVVSLPQAILFVSGEDRITPEARPIIENVAAAIRDLPNHVTLVGYADNLPISNQRFHNNWELAAERGLRLLELLTQEYGIPESRLSVSSEGANRPVSPNDTPLGRANNRRVEIVITESFQSIAE
ncbi:MAG TPA: OmpA family protein [Bryobacteraceae bacterium]|nr:OmpA family protein [Bryobacteraceae bacterium]